MMTFLSIVTRAPLTRLTPLRGPHISLKRLVDSYAAARATSLESNAKGNIVMTSGYAAVMRAIGGPPLTVDGHPGSQRRVKAIKFLKLTLRLLFAWSAM